MDRLLGVRVKGFKMVVSEHLDFLTILVLLKSMPVQAIISQPLLLCSLSKRFRGSWQRLNLIIRALPSVLRPISIEQRSIQ